MKALEKLNPDLIGYIEKSHLMTFFRHPLCVIPYTDGLEDKISPINGYINMMVTSRLNLISKMEADKDYLSLINIVERPFRLEYAIKYLNFISDTEYWDIVDFIWTDSEIPSIHIELWKTIFNSRKYANPTLKTAAFKDLPEQVTIYRGGNKKGLSWTTNRETAEWFAKRFSLNQTVMTAVVNKSNILHYTNSRNEQEIVAAPSSVNVLSEE
ncbi:hypothetical protein VXS06_14555 [Photobacterium toruni]|uniref:Uncharacterized protein n=1 Tax=Photobacterium toruni TaxID=1935446 RepID=A0ABU6L9B2_9GAMM|nr:hypothetical protein [Photobacterium toruni]